MNVECRFRSDLKILLFDKKNADYNTNEFGIFVCSRWNIKYT